MYVLRRYFRVDELILLLLVLVLYAVGYVQLTVTTGSTELVPTARGVLRILWPSMAPLLCFVVLSVLMHRFQPRVDQLLIPLTAFFSGMGLLFTARLDPSLAVLYPNTYPNIDMRQAVWVTLGIVMFGLIVLVPWDAILRKRTRMTLIDYLGHNRYVWLSIGLLLIVATLFFGNDPNNSGVRAWLKIGPMYFQPSELLKLALVIFLASYLDEQQGQLTSGVRWRGIALPSMTAMVPLLIMWGIAMVLIVIQRDLGAALMLFSVFLAMIYVATGRGLYAGIGLLAFVVGAYALYHFLPIVKLRVGLWLDPWSQARGYQSIQSIYALASGGVLGSGIGKGMPGMVPAAHTDYIFTSIGEELGMVGAVGLLMGYLLLAVRGYGIAMRLAGKFSMFEQLLAVGCTTILVIQTFIIIAGNLRVMPLTGITLPFVSYGGSAVLMNFVVMGLLARLSINQRDVSEAS
ncbi:MAG: FtsW/RodA/SpoVE family cell cycle protein [Chloroflexales bacterium]|nr:FtsW/RodA/SpoVE family cell cycle protein [Chloroflexales bacterium]